MKPKIFYSQNKYPSHLRAGKSYQQMIGSKYELVNHVRFADIVIFHREFPEYEGLFSKFPEIGKKYVISYHVWESDQLPREYARWMRKADEVWTASSYCKRTFSKYHPNVHVIPHVVSRRPRPDKKDREKVRRDVGFDSKRTYFLSNCVDIDMKRKNVFQLIDAFLRAGEKMPDATLIVKHRSPRLLGKSRIENVLLLNEYYSEAEMTALFELSSIYVSAHHSEGWGLNLSDAMMMGIPVLATGYSGNMEFMNRGNAVLLKYHLGTVGRANRWAFKPYHQWANFKTQDIEKALKRAYDATGSADEARRVSRARRDVLKFSYGNIKKVVLDRMDQIAHYF